MKVTTLLLALSCAFTFAADNTAVRQSIVNSPSSIVDGTDAITIPQMLSYQGKLTDTFGLPVADTLHAVRFRLYAQPTGGTQFWEENQQVRTQGGLFSTLLGSVTPIGSMPDAGALYLGMAVSGGAELAPRLRIASAAYAYLTARAANADLLQGRDTTTFSRSTHNHDATYVNEAQANSVTGAMLVDGTVKTSDVGDTSVTMAKLAKAGATTGEVIKWTGSVWNCPDNTGGGSGVTNVYQDTGIVCVPNPITSTGNVKLNLTYSDGRYVNEAQSNSVTSAMITDGNVTSADIRDTTVNTAELKDAAVTAAKLNQMGASSGQVMKWTGSAWAPRNDSVGGGGGDNAWVRGTPDSVLYTVHRLGIARGGSDNMLHGSFRQSHVNLGVSCTTGVSGQNYSNVTVGGGLSNRARAGGSTVGGGSGNLAGGVASVVTGGAGNVASGDYSTVAGGYGDTTLALCGGVLSGYLNKAGDAATDSCAVVAGGYGNAATGMCATVGGGHNDTASAMYSTVGGGEQNRATGGYATVAGGPDNLASGSEATVSGGFVNRASGSGAVVCGGQGNAASGLYSAIGGGLSNSASVRSATIPGGEHCAASGFASLAAGTGARARGNGSFVWADSAGYADSVVNTTANRWVTRARGGVYFYTNLGMTSGSYLTPAGVHGTLFRTV